ncbi:MAG: biotin/lipoyl-binding protein [Bacteroidetes bacterium]|nr:biotin/lipoyl-binding protein [Bacteroidota bacterium]
MKRFKFTISGNNYEVELKKFEDGKARIEVNGTCYNVELKKQEQTSKTPRLVRSSMKNPVGSHIIKKTESTGFKIVAPLPGNIMQIMVKVGDEVKKDDPLLIYEAMKMENKLLSEKAGIIKSINVAPGDSVLQDELLIELEIN